MRKQERPRAKLALLSQNVEGGRVGPKGLTINLLSKSIQQEVMMTSASVFLIGCRLPCLCCPTNFPTNYIPNTPLATIKVLTRKIVKKLMIVALS